jgi:NitT/TauT family transport system substrate-binding protein
LKRLFALLFSLMALSAVLGCNKPETSSPSNIRIQFDWVPEPEFGGYYQAELQGLFAARKLPVELRPGAAGTPVIQMVASGQAEFGVAGADDLLIAKSHGIDVVPVFAAFNDCPLGLMIHAERRLGGFEDLLESGTLAMTPGSAPTRYLEKRFGYHGVKLVPYGNNLATFMADPLFGQQCFITSEPVAAERAGAKVRVILFKELGYNPYAGVLFTRGDYARTHAEIVQKLVDSVREGWIAYQDNPEQAIIKMHDLNSTMSLETFHRATEIQEDYLRPKDLDPKAFGTMQQARWEALATTLKELGMIRGDMELGVFP